MLEFLSRLFGNNDSSKNMAKERLRLVLVQDRAMLSPGLLDSLQEDLIEVISKYMELDVTGLEVNLESQDQSVALVASIPVKNVKR
ncbi:MAG: cell division topological specificity factor MinE [Firmicutes bacterium]|nr:cell division topological specificity factor MinE [Bacillota bacterium]